MNQADLYERVTRRFFEDAGISTGMKVLDVGSGAGDVAFIAAEIVGPAGSVVGIDVNPDVLATARLRAQSERRDNVMFIDGDVRTSDIDVDFDAVVGRFVLMHTVDVAALLRTLAGRVRAGGIVAFAEGDLTIGLGYARTIPSELIRSMWDWSADAFRLGGVHAAMAPVLCREFIAAGLGEPHMFLHAPLGCREEWSGFDVDAESMKSIAPLLEKFGVVDAGVLDAETLANRYRAEVARTAYPFMMLPLVTAWARKPAA
jgi:SAM-dependent methyltransferase